MVELLPSKQITRVRFPSPALMQVIGLLGDYGLACGINERRQSPDHPITYFFWIGSSMAEQGAHNSLVTGSNPVRSTSYTKLMLKHSW